MFDSFRKLVGAETTVEKREREAREFRAAMAECQETIRRFPTSNGYKADASLHELSKLLGYTDYVPLAGEFPKVKVGGESQVFIQNLYKNGNDRFKDYPFEYSATASIVVILGIIKYSGFSGIISLVLIGFGIFKLTEFIRISVEKKLQSFKATIEDIKRDITIESQKANISPREVGMFAVNKLSEKVKVDIDFGRNVKGIFNRPNVT